MVTIKIHLDKFQLHIYSFEHFNNSFFILLCEKQSTELQIIVYYKIPKCSIQFITLINDNYTDYINVLNRVVLIAGSFS
jgi:hypothetical protein